MNCPKCGADTNGRFCEHCGPINGPRKERGGEGPLTGLNPVPRVSGDGSIPSRSASLVG